MTELKKIEKARNLFQKAYDLQQEGRFDEAINIYLLSIDLFPTAEAYTFLAWTYSCKGDFDAAISECKKAIILDPNYGNPYNDIGTYLIAVGNYEESIYWFDKAINAENYEQKYLPYFHLGRIMEKKSSWNDAINFYEKSLELNESFSPALFALGRLRSWCN